MFVLDSSGSVLNRVPDYEEAQRDWAQVIQFMVTVVERLNIGASYTRVGLVMYATNAIDVFELDTYTDKSTLLERISKENYVIWREYFFNPRLLDTPYTYCILVF